MNEENIIPSAIKKVKYPNEVIIYKINVIHCDDVKEILNSSKNKILINIGILIGVISPSQEPKNFAPRNVDRGIEFENTSFKVPDSFSPFTES